MELKQYLFETFEMRFKGKDKAIKRNDLWHFLNSDVVWNYVSDREMRATYEDLPICGSSKGLYLPENKAEIDEQIKLHWSKIYAYFRKIDILEHYHIESDSVQKELF